MFPCSSLILISLLNLYQVYQVSSIEHEKKNLIRCISCFHFIIYIILHVHYIFFFIVIHPMGPNNPFKLSCHPKKNTCTVVEVNLFMSGQPGSHFDNFKLVRSAVNPNILYYSYWFMTV